MTRTAEQIVNREVHSCVSYLVSTLAAGYGDSFGSSDLGDVAEQAFELCSPILDWEEAATQAGWYTFASAGGLWVRTAGANEPANETNNGQRAVSVANAQEACEKDDIEPYNREIFEHWIVSDWLADKLEAKGEKVDKDFAGMTVWARTTTGQGIASDSVIEAIVADLNKEA